MAAQLTSVPRDQRREGATEEAWSHVMDGCAKALEITGLPHSERDRLTRCRALAAEKAGRPYMDEAV